MVTIAEAIIPIVLLIVLGVFLKRYVITERDAWRAMGSMAYNVGFPALLVGDLMHATLFGLHLKSAVIAIVLATLLLSALTFLFKRLMRMEDRLYTSFFQGSIRFNSYIYLALAQHLYGNHGVAIASCYIAVMVIVTNCLSVFVLDRYGTGEKRSLVGTILETLKNPLIIASVVGFTLSTLHIVVPAVLDDTIHKIGGMALPLSLIAVGAGMRNVVQSLRSIPILLACFLKLAVLPAATFYFCSIFGVSGSAKIIATVYAALPVAGNAYILSEQMGGDTDSMASLISLSVLLCVIPMLLIFSLGH